MLYMYWQSLIVVYCLFLFACLYVCVCVLPFRYRKVSTYPDVVRQAQVRRTTYNQPTHSLHTPITERTSDTSMPVTFTLPVTFNYPLRPRLVTCHDLSYRIHSLPDPFCSLCCCAVLCCAVCQSDAGELWSTKLSKPGTWTWGDVAAAGIIGIQVVGAFALGEVIGRGSLIGYNVGDSHGH